MVSFVLKGLPSCPMISLPILMIIYFDLIILVCEYLHCMTLYPFFYHQLSDPYKALIIYVVTLEDNSFDQHFTLY